jgi:hypothetical protein
MLEARVCEYWAVHDDMLDGLDGFAALAGDLVWSVQREEPLGVLPCKSVTCYESIKGRMG